MSSWELRVSAETIYNCFEKSHIVPTNEEDMVDMEVSLMREQDGSVHTICKWLIFTEATGYNVLHMANCLTKALVAWKPRSRKCQH